MPADLSHVEKRNILWLLREHGVRIDGRSFSQTRSVSLQTDVLPSAAGSARILVRGGNDVLASTNTELRQFDVAIDADTILKKGSVGFSVEFCGVASPEFQGRGSEVVEVELVSLLESMYSSSAEFLLHLVAGERKLASNPSVLRVCCWEIYVDVLILGASGGNIVDAVSYAVRSAIATTFVPAVFWQEDALGGSWELDERAECCHRLDVTHAPVCSSGAFMSESFLAERIGSEIPELVVPQWLILDPCAEEESLAGCTISVAGTKHRQICAVWKSGAEPVSLDLTLEATRLCETECALLCDEMDAMLVDMDRSDLDEP
ncbi:Exosome complex component RRP42 [Cyanidiococcus yangmingshanensis]|uniref:Ribosomal RNA-processing protein 42 n=1 Tax=Cyanidiococcus yangmingshanensis TaxID=2690220 RepID=A0A7J7IDJ1_9RHOD|nr:Exosome complex component RRP42 [Cyanidiococcus yangmingshanensis]